MFAWSVVQMNMSSSFNLVKHDNEVRPIFLLTGEEDILVCQIFCFWFSFVVDIGCMSTCRNSFMHSAHIVAIVEVLWLLLAVSFLWQRLHCWNHWDFWGPHQTLDSCLLCWRCRMCQVKLVEPFQSCLCLALTALSFSLCPISFAICFLILFLFAADSNFFVRSSRIGCHNIKQCRNMRENSVGGCRRTLENMLSNPFHCSCRCWCRWKWKHSQPSHLTIHHLNWQSCQRDAQKLQINVLLCAESSGCLEMSRCSRLLCLCVMSWCVPTQATSGSKECQNDHPSLRSQRKTWESRNHLQQLHDSIDRCWKFLPISETETSEKNSLSELTTVTDTNENPASDKICPQHFQALQQAGPVTKKIPTMTEQLQHNKEAKAVKLAEGHSNNERNRRTTTHFCIGHSNIWSKQAHSIIKTIKDKFNLQWLRLSMSYHKFTNLREIFQGDLSRKLTVGLTSKEFEHAPCNCRTRGNGACSCSHKNMCRNSMAVHKSNATTQEIIHRKHTTKVQS